MSNAEEKIEQLELELKSNYAMLVAILMQTGPVDFNLNQKPEPGTVVRLTEHPGNFFTVSLEKEVVDGQ